MIPDEFAGPSNGRARAILAIDFTAARVEPIGHLLDGKELALIVYRIDHTCR